MQKINTFIHVFKNSIFPTPNYYKQIKHTKLFFSFKYFVMLIFIINLITIPFFLNKIFSGGKIDELKTQINQTLSKYPQDLKIQIKNNRLTTNLNKPYIMWISLNSVPNALFVIDERADLQDLQKYNGIFLVNSDHIIVNDKNDFKINKLTVKSDIEIDKLSVEKFREYLNSFFTILPFFSVFLGLLIIIFVPLFVVFFKTLYLITISVFAFLLTRPFNHNIHFKRVFQISLHASTIPTVVGALVQLSITNLSLHGIFYLLTLIFVLSAIYEAYLYQEI